MDGASVITQEELNFLHHYLYEVLQRVQPGPVEPGPAVRWLVDRGIPTTWMQVFEYAGQVAKDDFVNWVSNEPPGPFQMAWASREEFESRVLELLEIYPKVKVSGSAVPGYQP
jgi:hypothetical protein